MISFYFTKSGGQINFGYIDANKYKGELIEHPVVDKYYWTIKMNDLKLNSTEKSCDPFCYAIIDSGSSGLMVSQGLYDKIKKQIKMSFPCDELKSMPDMEFVLNGKIYSLTPNEYTYEHFDKKRMKKVCKVNISTIYLSRFKEDFIVIGEDFFKKYYIIFDKDRDSVHLGYRN